MVTSSKCFVVVVVVEVDVVRFIFIVRDKYLCEGRK